MGCILGPTGCGTVLLGAVDEATLIISGGRTFRDVAEYGKVERLLAEAAAKHGVRPSTALAGAVPGRTSGGNGRKRTACCASPY